MSEKQDVTVDDKTAKEGPAEKPPVKAETEQKSAAEAPAAKEPAPAAEGKPAEKPAVKPVAADKPAADKPAVEKPAAEKPAAAAKAPAAKAPAAKAPAAAKPAAAVETTTVPDHFTMRRRLVWTSVVAFLSTISLMLMRFFLPRAIFEPSTVFRIGYPGDFGIGVDTKFQGQYRIWVVRNAERLFVIYARCTHLGCTPDWKAGENKFKCPCHGSGFDSEGINFEGPAPRPLDRAKVEVSPEGQIVVDINKLYNWPKGAPSQFNDPGSFINV